MEASERVIQHAVRRLGRRVRCQTAARWSIKTLFISTLCLSVAVIAYQLWWISTEWVETTAWAGGTLILGGLFAALFRSQDRLALAEKLDRANDLHDRLGTALDILKRQPSQRTEFELAQLQDATKHAQALNIAPAAPWTFPREIFWALGSTLLLLAGTQLQVEPPSLAGNGIQPVLMGPISKLPVPTPPDESPSAKSETDELQQEAESQLRENIIHEDELTGGDEKALEVLSKLNRALAELAQRPDDIDPRALTSIVSEAEEAVDNLAGTAQKQANEEKLEEKLEKLSEALEKKAEKTLRGPKAAELMKDLAKSLRERDYETSAKKLNTLMEMYSKLPRREQERLAKMFDALGKKFESQLQKDMDRLRKKRDRLRKKQNENQGLSKRERRRLNKTEKQLDRLQRQQDEKQSEPQKQLDRLSREMQRLAQKMRRQPPDKKQGAKQQKPDGPQQKKNRLNKRSAKELSEMLKRMAKRRKQRRAGQKMKMKMADMKELLQRRRRKMKRGRKRLERLAKGKQSQGSKNGPPKGMQQGQTANDKKGLLYRQRKEGRQNWTRRRNDSDNGAGRTRRQMLSGSETDIEAKTLEDFVEGKEGTGASTREILYGAAKKGSRIKGYGKVHIDYSMRASRQMEDEKIPPGYREYVEEYFRLIRAR
jgi:hypothetical protein